MPITAPSAYEEASSVGEIGCAQTCHETKQTESLARLVARVEIPMLTHSANIDCVLISDGFGISQGLLLPALFAENQTFVLGGIGPTLSKTVATAEQDEHLLEDKSVDALSVIRHGKPRSPRSLR